MSSRFNNKRLLILLSGLIIIMAITYIIKIPRESATLKDKIVEFDSTEVSKITIYPRAGTEDVIKFMKKDGKWTVQQGSITAAAQNGAAQSLFIEVLNIKPQSLMAINKSKWEEFELTDSLATRITFMNNNGKNLADLMIGKFTYKQPGNSYGMYGRNNIQGTSYVRLYDENEIFGVDGFIALEINRKFDDWRDNSFIHLKKGDITNIKFTLSDNSEFNLSKRDSMWYVGDRVADSMNISNYIEKLSYLNGENFRDDFKPVSNPEYRILIEGNNLLNITVNCYNSNNSDEYILNSSVNPDVYFASKKDGIFQQLFKPESYFIKQNRIN